jgi:hypothetical protein
MRIDHNKHHCYLNTPALKEWKVYAYWEANYEYISDEYFY